MPIYTFKCKSCIDQCGEPYKFDIYIPAYKDNNKKEFSDTSHATCPRCGETTDRRVFNSSGFIFGMTLSEKEFGASKQRVETSKYLREERRKRQKENPPGTLAHDSNELWTDYPIDGITK